MIAEILIYSKFFNQRRTKKCSSICPRCFVTGWGNFQL